MEGEGRGFTEVNVTECAAQPGKERFPRKADPGPPAVARWRNNLTALSQCRNLYFVAYMDEIHVYRPQFPEQTLPKRPGLTFELPISRPGLMGEIDLVHAHSINQIVVGDIGNEELLVCVCDDGDVVAYATRTLEIVERTRTRGPSKLNEGEKIRTFFHRNVGRSAWGIAMHKAGRVIAVSANTKLVTVFAFALGSESSSDSTSEDNDEDACSYSATHHLGAVDWEERPHLGTVSWGERDQYLPAERSRSNIEITLSGHGTNVPNVAFCNMEEDLTGRYLMSTDIDGVTINWDLWRGTSITKSSLTSSPNPYGGLTRGWAVLCLDRRSFRLTEGARETFGCEPKPHEGGWDISTSRNDVRGACTWHSAFAGFSPVPGVQLPFGMVDETEAQGASPGEVDEEDWVDDDLEEDDDLGLDPPQHATLQGFGFTQLPVISGIQNVSSEPQQLENVSTHDPIADIQPSLPPGRRRIYEDNIGDLPLSANFPPITLPFSILQTSETDIIFRSSALHPTATILRHPLAQSLPPSLHSLSHFDRLNMSAQIPELGLVFIASQVGRVALLTLTRMRDTKHSAFRLDCILPTKDQEARGERPGVPLLGMAVGPIQGREMMAESSGDGGSPDGRGREAWRAIDGSRRYRLMLTYYDHSVLSYELGRGSRKGPSGQAADELLVF